jgi:hypothetical protein
MINSPGNKNIKLHAIPMIMFFTICTYTLKMFHHHLEDLKHEK